MALVLAVLVLRVAYLVWLCPYELVADEAYYWDWSRRAELSYSSKGPGVAWVIALSTFVFGVHEWSVRLPAAVASAVAALGLARLAMACTGGDQRVGFLTAVAFCLTPAFQAVAQLMTIDGPYVACWVLAAWAAAAAFDRMARGQSARAAWLGTGVALGAGFLFKYTIVLLAAGMALYAVLARRRLRWDRRAAVGVFLCAAAFGVCVLPVALWNAARGWPTVTHLLGHLGVRPDFLAENGPGRTPKGPSAWSYRPGWTLGLIGSQIGMIGPVLAVMGWAVVRALRRGGRQAGPPGQAMMICFAAPVLVFFLLVSFVTDVEGNWPLAGYTTLLVAAVQCSVGVFWPRGPRNQTAPPGPPRRPAAALRAAWWATAAYGVLAGAAIAAPGLAASVPVVGRYVPMRRITGHRAVAARVHAATEHATKAAGHEPVIVTDYYTRTALLAFYLPGHPRVYCAASRLGGGRVAYDFFADTNLGDPRLTGRTLVMVGSTAADWERIFRFDRLDRFEGDGSIFLGEGFRGPRQRGARSERR